MWLHSLKVAQLLRSAACLHTNQSPSYLNHLLPGLSAFLSVVTALRIPKIFLLNSVRFPYAKFNGSVFISFFYETHSLIQRSRIFRYKLTSAHGVMKLHGHFLERTLNVLFKKGRNPLPHPVLGTRKYSPNTHTQFLFKSTSILSSLLCKRLKLVCYPTTILHISYEYVTHYAHFIILDFISIKLRGDNYKL